MPNEFNPTEFRRRRNDAIGRPAENMELPLETPVSVDPNAPQEWTPSAPAAQIVSEPTVANPYENAAVPQPGPAIPDAVPNPYAAALNTETPAIAPVYVQPPAGHAAVAAPMPAMPVPTLGSTIPVAEVPADNNKSKSLFAGLFAKAKSSKPKTAKTERPKKVKKSKKVKASKTSQMEPQTPPSGPVLFDPSSLELGVKSAPAEQVVAYQAPVHVPEVTPEFMAQTPVRAQPVAVPKSARTKPRIPTWAAFAMGAMTGIILTFAGLAFTSKTVNNSLEAKFGAAAAAVEAPVQPIADVAALPEENGTE